MRFRIYVHPNEEALKPFLKAIEERQGKGGAGDSWGCALNGQKVERDHRGWYFVIDGFIDALPEFFRSIEPTDVVLTDKNSTNFPAEGVYRRRRAGKRVQAVVDSYDQLPKDQPPLHTWTLEITGPNLASVTEMYHDVRAGRALLDKRWSTQEG